MERCRNQAISQITAAIDLYSISVGERDKIFFFPRNEAISKKDAINDSSSMFCWATCPISTAVCKSWGGLWKDNKIYFPGDPFKSLKHKMQHLYGVYVVHAWIDLKYWP